MFVNRNPFPFWLGGLLVALVIILIGTRVGTGPGNPVLTKEFAPRPTDPNAPTPQPLQLPHVNLPSLPANVQRTVTELQNRLAGGEAVPPLTPVATGPRVRVEVQQVQRRGESVQIRGSIKNIANGPAAIPTTAFSFRDSAGITYALTETSSVTLQPGESTALDLSVPLPAQRGLTLIVDLPPDPPLEQTLLVETKP